MESMQNIVEYYDELFPISESINEFYNKIIKRFKRPAKFLGIAANTGTLEFHLARKGCDITGIEVSQPFLDSAILKRRSQLLSIRFFNLSIIEMRRFLGKNFYNAIYCLNNRITFIRNQESMKAFFKDCKELLCEGGIIILQFHNYEKLKNPGSVFLEEQKSIRATLSTSIMRRDDNHVFITQKLETGNKKIIPIMQDEEILPLTRENVIHFGKKAGFRNFEFYSGFDMTPYTEASENILCIIS